MIEFIQHMINGISLGSMYALIALGYTMVFGILKFINFAHGEIYMLGAFSGYYLSRWLNLGAQPSYGGFMLALVLSMCLCAVVGFTIERLAYRPLRDRPRINVLITAVGVSLLLQYAGQLVFGADPKFFPPLLPAQKPLIFNWGSDSLQINTLQLVICLIAIGLMMLLRFVVFHTRLGLAMRAVSYDHRLATLMGIAVDRVISVTFMLGSALAAAAGVLVAMAYPKIEPLMGTMPGLKAFVAAVFGGIGNITGAVVGSVTLGLAEEMVVGYGASTYREALAFGILILILIVKPSGLLGQHQTEKV